MEAHIQKWNFFEKFLLKTFYGNNKGIRKVKNFQKLSLLKFTSSFNVKELNTRNLSNSFHGQTSLKDTIFSVLKFWVKLLLIGLRNVLMGIFFLILQYVESAMHRIFCVLDVKKFLLLLNWAQMKPFWRRGILNGLHNSTSFLRVFYNSCLTDPWC